MTQEMMKSEAGKEIVPQFVPRADVWEEVDRVVVDLDLPGVDPKSIDVTVENGTLSISARSASRPSGGAGWLAAECPRGEFWRTFNLGDALDAGAISAEYADGVLRIAVPKTEVAKPQKIDVRVK